MATTLRRPALHGLAERLGHAEALDGPAEAVAGRVRGAVGPGPVKDALSGRWLGHALHPLLTDLPIGSWTSASILDLAGGPDARAAADRLLMIGIATAVPAAATGMTDWADTTPADAATRRMGAVHAVANTVALGLYSASLVARRRDRRRSGVLLALAGMGVLSVSGYLGGELSYGRAVGVDQTVFDAVPEEWTDVAAASAVPEGGLLRAEAGGTPVLLARRAGRLHALADRCAHRGGSLADGRLEGDCVECPLHGSRFRLTDGSVVRGPSPYPQPAHAVRERDGRIEVRAGD